MVQKEAGQLVEKPALSGTALGIFCKCKNLTIYRPTAEHLQKVMGLMPSLLPLLTRNSLYSGKKKNVLMSVKATEALQTPEPPHEARPPLSLP